MYIVQMIDEYLRPVLLTNTYGLYCWRIPTACTVDEYLRPVLLTNTYGLYCWRIPKTCTYNWRIPTACTVDIYLDFVVISFVNLQVVNVGKCFTTGLAENTKIKLILLSKQCEIGSNLDHCSALNDVQIDNINIKNSNSYAD